MASSLDAEGNLFSQAEGEHAVIAHFDLMKSHSRNQMIMRLSLFMLAAFFVVSAAILVVFAPAGREIATWIVCAALVVVAAGAAGFGAFAVKVPKVEDTFSRQSNLMAARKNPNDNNKSMSKYMNPSKEDIEENEIQAQDDIKNYGRRRKMPIVLNPDGSRRVPRA